MPIGYADGLARVLSNHMDVLVNGVRVRQVGRICMDQFMFAVDTSRRSLGSVKTVAPVECGDVVTILGTDCGQTISADEMARLRDTINYVLLSIEAG